MVRVHASVIVDHYRRRQAQPKKRLEIDISEMTLTNLPRGLGDTLILTDLPRAAHEAGRFASIHSDTELFQRLVRYNPYYRPAVGSFWVNAAALCHEYDLGGGHFFQRLRRAFGYERDFRPRGCVELGGDRDPVRGCVVVHLEPGRWADWQRQHIHPRAREIYPETRASLEAFIEKRPDLSFIEVGAKPSRLRGVVDQTGRSIEETIALMASAEYFLGINSGPLHLAAALGLRLISIVNFPPAPEIVLPVLKDVPGHDLEWLYPQSVILHQDEGSDLVRQVSAYALNQAFDGELYPYFSERYLPLLFEARL